MKKVRFLYFSKREKSGVLLLLSLITLLVATDVICSKYLLAQTELQPEVQVLISHSSDRANRETCTTVDNQLFSFDPNTIDSIGWQKLGLNPKQVHTIRNYLSKGGTFKKPEDLRKIWGLSTSLAEQLIPFVQIKQKENDASDGTQYQGYISKKTNFIEINQADSASLESLPGIGPALARRIVLYREKLGGFYEIAQLKEVWGLNDTLIQKFHAKVTLDTSNIRKMDVNTVGFDILKSHPYFRYKTAKAILDFRNQHGLFKTLEDIQKIILIDEGLFKKIIHYLIIKK